MSAFHVSTGEPPLPGAKLRHVGPHDVPSLRPRERLMRGSGDPYDALSAVIATLRNYGIVVGDVDKVLR